MDLVKMVVSSSDEVLSSVEWNDNTGQKNLNFVPRISIGELSSTFYAEFRIFLSDRVSKIQRKLSVKNSTLRAHETGRNFPLKC
jgi:hypothetical protein